MIRLLFFAVAKQKTGCDAVELALAPGATVADLKGLLAEKYPGLKESLPKMSFAVNAEYATDQTILPANAEVACIPPVSGG